MKNFKSLIEFQKHFGTDEQCRAYLEEQRWHGKPCCPRCGSERVYRLKSMGRFNCGNRQCKKIFTVTVGTVYENTKIPLNKWFLAMYVTSNHSKGISSLQLAGYIDVTQTTAWFLLHRIREMMREKIPVILEDTVEVDETYVGGKRSNKHAWKRRELMEQYGPGFLEKTPVVGLIQREGKVISHSIKKADGKTLKPILIEKIKKGSIVMTDGLGGYAGLSHNFPHVVINHEQGFYGIGSAHTNSIEGYWSFFKRCIYGIYHSISPKHLDRYCDEISHRFNERKLSQDEKFANVVSRCHGRVKFKDLTSNAVETSEAEPVYETTAADTKSPNEFKSMAEYMKNKKLKE